MHVDHQVTGPATLLGLVTAPWENLTIEVHGLRLAARAHGPAGGVPVLCLHGWLDNAASFETLAPGLVGFRVVALDLPGHGFSSHRDESSAYAFVDTVAAVAAARDALGWSSCVLIGHSLGAAIASVLAGAEPARVTRLVLLEGIGPLSESPAHAAARLGRSLEEERTKAGRRPPVYADAEQAALRLASGMARLSIDAARRLCRRGLVEVPGGVTWRSDPRVRWQSRLRLTEDHVLAFLRAISCPTLLVVADDGPLKNEAALASRIAAVADLRVHRVAGRHHVHLEEPGTITPLVVEFLAPLQTCT